MPSLDIALVDGKNVMDIPQVIQGNQRKIREFHTKKPLVSLNVCRFMFAQ